MDKGLKVPSTFQMAIPKGQILEVQQKKSLFWGLRSDKIKARPGVYVWALKKGISLPQLSGMVLPKYTTVTYKGDEYNVIYVGKHETSLSKRLNEHHHGKVDWSSFREDLALLFGFEINQGKEKTISSDQEDFITNWINNSCVVFFSHCEFPETIERRYIDLYQPPLNTQLNLVSQNSEYIDQLRRLRNE